MYIDKVKNNVFYKKENLGTIDILCLDKLNSLQETIYLMGTNCNLKVRKINKKLKIKSWNEPKL